MLMSEIALTNQQLFGLLVQIFHMDFLICGIVTEYFDIFFFPKSSVYFSTNSSFGYTLNLFGPRRVVSSLVGEKGGQARQSAVRHEAPPQNRGAHHAHGARSLQEREEAGGGALAQQPEGARQRTGARQQPQYHLLTQAEAILNTCDAITFSPSVHFLKALL